MKTLIGLCYPVCAVLDEETNTYGKGFVLGEAIKESISISKNDVKLYGDDKIVAADQSFKEGDGSFDTTGISDENVAVLLGHEVSTDNTVISRTTDVAPYVGHGFYSRNYQNKFRAVFFPKVQFSEPNTETETKGESTAYKSPSLSYKVMEGADRQWKKEKTFDTEKEARAWLNGLVNIETVSEPEP